jgi:hypothetical protein
MNATETSGAHHVTNRALKTANLAVSTQAVPKSRANATSVELIRKLEATSPINFGEMCAKMNAVQVVKTVNALRAMDTASTEFCQAFVG